MSTTFAPITPHEASTPTPLLRRFGSLVRAEFVLLLRNRIQLFTALALPLGVPLLMLPLKNEGLLEGAGAAAATGTMMVFLLLFVVYYNLTCSYVARREERVLERLRAGTVPQPLVLASTAAPAVVLAFVQTALMCAIGALVLDLPAPVNAPLLVVAVVLAVGAFIGLALITTTFTKNVEAAQITTLPIVSVCILASGAAIPLDFLPQFVPGLLSVVPSAAMVELTSLAWLGITDDGARVDAFGAITEAWLPALVLAAWCWIGVNAVEKRFRWSPRG